MTPEEAAEALFFLGGSLRLDAAEGNKEAAALLEELAATAMGES